MKNFSKEFIELVKRLSLELDELSDDQIRFLNSMLRKDSSVRKYYVDSNGLVRF